MIFCDLSHNSIAVLSTEIGNMAGVSYLYLHYNQIAEFPTQIGQMTALASLQCDRNRLTTLPTEMAQLKNLVRMDVSNNFFDCDLVPTLECSAERSLSELSCANACLMCRL